MTKEEILKTEYCEEFDSKRKDMMVMSFYKYGPVSDNYSEYKCMDAMGNVQKRIAKYQETGNREFLLDAANFLMIEYMFPQHKDAHYKATDSGAVETVGFGVNEVKREMGEL